ncbi:diguanylate cyclase domain-containing protein [Agromyces flavus]|uniref:diguanylate cyclase domain-containing protein n=1 Tax=Agromyces flavus TaxID=589382 RepID=UPI00361260BB
MRAAGVHALIAAPLHHEEMDFGAFISWFHHVRTFDDEAAPLAEALAGQAAQALATLRLQNRLAHAATHDDVTGLPNRRLLELELSTIVGEVGCATLFVDLDGFKEVNDRLGHHAGDRLLHDAGRRLLSGGARRRRGRPLRRDEFVIVCRTDDPAARDGGRAPGPRAASRAG